jgi:hypothetical protein
MKSKRRPLAVSVALAVVALAAALARWRTPEGEKWMCRYLRGPDSDWAADGSRRKAEQAT